MDTSRPDSPRAAAGRDSARAPGGSLRHAVIQSALMEFAVETRGLARTFGSKRAVDGIDLQVPAGSFYGFLGPNGAGKSTTIKCLTGLLRPSAGEIRILGIDPVASPVEIKLKV